MVLNYHVTAMSQNGETSVLAVLLAVFFGRVTIQILLISCVTYQQQPFKFWLPNRSYLPHAEKTLEFRNQSVMKINLLN